MRLMIVIFNDSCKILACPLNTKSYTNFTALHSLIYTVKRHRHIALALGLFSLILMMAVAL